MEEQVMIKVSVIIPTYNNKEDKLNRIVESLNKQTLNSSEFEVLFIDDGSDDFSAFSRLKEKTREYIHYQVHRISPSGWGSRPRNKGTKVAQGEYVFFCDDDDTIFPQALERMYNFAKDNDLDVVNPKVIRTKGWGWGWEQFKENVVGAETIGVQAMGPMTVPKLYRRTFIEQHNLYFYEGDKVWWEDVMFSCLVFSKNPRIGILADYPVYHWREQNHSAGFGKDLEYKWEQINNVASSFKENLKGEDLDYMITHWYRTRVLGALRGNFHKKSKDTQQIEFDKAMEWKDRFVESAIVERLDTRHKIIDYLLGKGRLDLVRKFSQSKAETTSRSYLRTLSFEEDSLIITTDAVVTYDEERNVNFKGSPNEVQIDCQEEIKSVLPASLLYMNELDSKGNQYSPSIKGRFTRTTWEVQDVIDSKFHFDQHDSYFNVRGELTFRLTLDDFIQDYDDAHQPWDLSTKFNYMDVGAHRAIASKQNFKKAAIINGNTYVVYKNKSELVSIDLNSIVHNFLAVAKLDLESMERQAGLISIPIKNVYAYGQSEVSYVASIYNDETEAFVDSEASIIVDGDSAYLQVDNTNNLKGNCKIEIALGEKSHAFEVNI